MHLGGLVLKKGQNVDFRPLFESFKLHDVGEVKLRTLIRGDFVKCLKSQNLQSIFEYLILNNVSIHYSSLNFQYYSLVDLIDSLCEATGIYYDLFFNRALKNDLYICFKNNSVKFKHILYKFKYPNIKADRIFSFIDELITIFEDEQRSDGNRTILKLLKESKNSKDLASIMYTESHQLISSFFQLYARNIYMFLNSEHFFDKEDSIEPLLSELTYDNKKIENYTFVDSKNNLNIQLSDIVIGFIGKLYNFINDNDFSAIDEHLIAIDSDQRKTLKFFCRLLQKSELENRAYIHLAISNLELEKLNYLEEYC
jgi:hypothetical protein